MNDTKPDSGDANYLELLAIPSLNAIYIRELFDDYRDCYLNDKSHQEFVQASSRIPDELKEHSIVGVCDRTSGKRIRKAKTLDGGAKRGSLIRDGLYIPPHCGELFRGCIVFPEVNNNGDIISAVGYRFGDRIRKGDKSIVYWKKPEPDGFITKGIQLAQGLIDAKTRH